MVSPNARSNTPAKEAQSTISQFIDDYSFALKLYVSHAPSSAEKYQRIEAVWDHALSKLSARELSEVEAVRRWRPTFVQALGGLFTERDFAPPEPMEKANDYHVTVPSGREGSDDSTTEWNPIENRLEPIPQRELRTTAIDHCIDMSVWSWHKKKDQFNAVKVILPAFEPRGVWDLTRLSFTSLSSPQSLEGLILSALLFLDHSRKGSPRILSSHFPRAASEE